MAAFRVKLMDFLKAGPSARGHVDLTADDRLNPGVFTGAVEVHHAVHHAVVRNGTGALTQVFDHAGQIPDAAGPVQQTVFRVDVQMDKRHKTFLSRFPRFPRTR